MKRGSSNAYSLWSCYGTKIDGPTRAFPFRKVIIIGPKENIASGTDMMETIAFFLPTLDIGGAERVTVNLVNELSRRGYDVDVLLSRTDGGLVSSVEDDVSIVNICSRFSTPWPELYVTRHLRDYLNRNKPDTLVSALALSNVIASSATKLSNSTVDLILTVHAPPGQQSQVKYRISHFVGQYTYRFADEIVAVSHGVRDDLLSEMGISKENIRVIYNPIVDDELTRLSQEEVGHEWFNDTVPVIISVGSLRRHKGQQTLLDAVHRLSLEREVRLVLIGDGSYRNHLERMVDDMGIDSIVDFLGEENNPYKYMASSSVLASSSRYEGFGNVLVEALACGCPVVSTDCPYGPSEILENGKYGRLVPVSDADSMAEALDSTLDEETDASYLKTRASDFHVSEIADQYEMLL